LGLPRACLARLASTLSCWSARIASHSWNTHSTGGVGAKLSTVHRPEEDVERFQYAMDTQQSTKYCPLGWDTMSQAGHIAQIRSDPSLRWRWAGRDQPASLPVKPLGSAATTPRQISRPSTSLATLRSHCSIPRRAPVHHHIFPPAPPKKGSCSQAGVPLGPRRWIGRSMVTHSALDCWTLFGLSFHQRRLVMVHCPEVAEPYAEGQ
jgi:hypothetical protein